MVDALFYCTLKTEQRAKQETNINQIWSSPRPISIAKLNTLLHLHLQPINLVVYKGSY